MLWFKSWTSRVCCLSFSLICCFLYYFHFAFYFKLKHSAFGSARNWFTNAKWKKTTKTYVRSQNRNKWIETKTRWVQSQTTTIKWRPNRSSNGSTPGNTRFLNFKHSRKGTTVAWCRSVGGSSYDSVLQWRGGAFRNIFKKTEKQHCKLATIRPEDHLPDEKLECLEV